MLRISFYAQNLGLRKETGDGDEKIPQRESITATHGMSHKRPSHLLRHTMYKFVTTFRLTTIVCGMGGVYDATAEMQRVFGSRDCQTTGRPRRRVSQLQPRSESCLPHQRLSPSSAFPTHPDTHAEQGLLTKQASFGRFRSVKAPGRTTV